LSNEEKYNLHLISMYGLDVEVTTENSSDDEAEEE
jgi:hypothetical protein